jgi:hypothetical protein
MQKSSPVEFGAEKANIIMKQALLTFLAFCAAISTLKAQSQPYLPTAVEGANWIVQNSEINDTYISFAHSIEGDTMVNGQTYKKLYRRIIDHTREVFTDPELMRPYEVFPGRELIFLLRDDVGERRVFGRAVDENANAVQLGPDTLLHDYSLQEGDTLAGLNFDGFGGPSIITEVTYENRFGQERRVQKTGGSSFYEGVGSSVWGPTSGPSLLVGLGIFQLRDYCEGSLENCQVWLTPVTELTPELSIKTHPNPFTNHLNFLPSNDQTGAPVTVSLRDVTGRLLREGKLGSGLEWNTENLAPGLYLAAFVSGDRRETVKLIK